MRMSIVPGAPIHLTMRVYGPSDDCELDGLIDTGSLFVTIPPLVARELGYVLEDAPLVSIVTASGIARARQITLTRIVLTEEFSVTDIPALCLDVTAAGTSSLLGLSLLRHLNVFVDNKAGVLTITDP